MLYFAIPRIAQSEILLLLICPEWEWIVKSGWNMFCEFLKYLYFITGLYIYDMIQQCDMQ